MYILNSTNRSVIFSDSSFNFPFVPNKDFKALLYLIILVFCMQIFPSIKNIINTIKNKRVLSQDKHYEKPIYCSRNPNGQLHAGV